MIKGFIIVCNSDMAVEKFSEQELQDDKCDISIIVKEPLTIKYLFKRKVFKGLKGKLFKAFVKPETIRFQLMNQYPELKEGSDYDLEVCQE